MELESNNHSVFLMHYHLVLVVKYRRRVITDAVSDRAREIFERIAPTYGITLEEWNHDVDHVHMLFRAQPPTEEGVPRDQAQALEGVLLEQELLPAYDRRSPHRGHPPLHREPGAEMTVTMHKAVVYRAYPTREQAALIERTCGCARFVYNRMLADKIAHYEKTGEMLKVTPARYKREFPWLKEVDSFALCNAQLNLDATYRNFFRRVKAGEKPGFTRYKAKHRSRCCYKTNFVNGNIRFEGDERYLRLPKLGSVRVRQKREIDPSWRIKSATVEHTRSGRFEVSVLFEFETQEPEQVEPESFVGLDYSSHDLYVTSDGERPGYPRYFRHAERKLAREQRKLSRMQKGSANWRKQKLRVARVHEKMKNQRKDFHHKAANGLVERYDCVCVENLDMRGMSRSLKLGKSTMDNGFGMFRALLGYKLEDRGKRLVTVGRLFPSSQLCHECGYRFSGTKDLSVREWTCPLCGRTHDRDVNAARNIRDEGMRLALSA